ncbi:uncharacterized protein LOC126683435 isoform X2 [Mercurialis annua]|uniref:uncharacterized protein LOC126683435 isoform X2 n=1 Tax=Mercurialis annua TaxID=3986 RepID=UPI00215E3CDA|nr:uncharacterized protein LOC126683435 isoform X2 [Mercurialis annua]
MTENLKEFSNSTPQKMLNDECFKCKRKGHWANECPNKSPKKSAASSPKNSTNSIPATPVRCPWCFRLCRLKTSQTEKNPDRDYYACPVPGKNHFFQWFDEFSSIVAKAPKCRCGAGICSVSKIFTGVYAERWYYACRLKKDFGKCEFFGWADPEVNTMMRRNGSESKEHSSLQSRTYIANSDMNKIEMSFEINVAEKFANISFRKPSDRFEIPKVDLVMQKEESSDVNKFQVMNQSISPSPEGLWRRVSVGEKHTNEGKFCSFNPLASSQDSGIVCAKIEDCSGLMQTQSVSWKSKLKTVGRALFSIFDSMNPLDPAHMVKVAEPILIDIQKFSIECGPFVKNVNEYIRNVSILISVEESMRRGPSSQELNNRYESEKVEFEEIFCRYSDAKEAHGVSDKYLKLLGDEVSGLKGVDIEVEEEFAVCETETKLLEARVNEAFEDVFESKVHMQIMSYEIAQAAKLEQQREWVWRDAMAALEKARLWLELL